MHSHQSPLSILPHFPISHSHLHKSPHFSPFGSLLNPSKKHPNLPTTQISKFSNSPNVGHQVSSFKSHLVTNQSVEQYPDAEFSNYYLGHDDNDVFGENEIDPVWLVTQLQSKYTLKEVKAIHAVIVKRLENLVVYAYNNLINVYIKFGEVVEARKVFDGMSERSVVSWTTMLSGYLKLRLYDEAFGLLSEFFDSGVRANSLTFVCMMNLCGRRFDYALGKQVHGNVIKVTRGSNLIVDSAILHFYAQCGDFESALRVFDRMSKRDVVSWTSMITCCAQQGFGDYALSLFSQMVTEEYTPNEHTVCSVLKACAGEQALNFGRQLHGIVVKKLIKDDVFIGTSLVDMYAKCGESEDARKVFDRMNKRNMVTWTSIITGYAGNGHGYEALDLFREMKRRKVFVNNMTLVSVLRACGVIGSLSSGKEIHAQVLKSPARNNIYIGSTLVWLYCKCKEYSLASTVLQQMPIRDVVSWTALISGCNNLGYESEALEFLKEMLGDGVEPNSFTYSSALKSCANSEAIDHGKLIHSSVNKYPEFSDNIFVGSSLISMYVKCGYVSEAFQVFSSMPKKNLIAWTAMIVGFARNGYCPEAMKLMDQMQTEGIQVDDYIVSTLLNACADEWNSQPTSEQSLHPS